MSFWEFFSDRKVCPGQYSSDIPEVRIQRTYQAELWSKIRVPYLHEVPCRVWKSSPALFAAKAASITDRTGPLTIPACSLSMISASAVSSGASFLATSSEAQTTSASFIFALINGRSRLHPNSKERSMELRRFTSFLRSDSKSSGAAAAI